MRPFISTIKGKLDSKGRVCVPTSFRDVLASQHTDGVYICPSFAEIALECFSNEVLEVFQNRLRDIDIFFTQEYNDRAFAVMSMTQFLIFDENGRMRVPDDLIAHAALSETVAFVGMGSKFQLWDEQKFKATLEERLTRARLLRLTQEGAIETGR